MMGEAGGDQHHRQQEEGGAGDDEGKQMRLDHARMGRRQQIGLDRDRTHGGEMQRDDPERHQQGGKDLRLQRLADTGDRAQSGDVKQRADDHGGDDQCRIPADAARHVERRHAKKMHAGDAAAENEAASNPAEAVLNMGRDQ